MNLTPQVEPITFRKTVSTSGSATVEADRFPDLIAVLDALPAEADRTIWRDAQAFLNIRVANGWATYYPVRYRPELRCTEYIRVASYLEPRP